MFYKSNNTEFEALKPITRQNAGKVYADVPLSFFENIESLKNYVLSLKELGVNVLLILPHFLPSFSAYVVRNYEQPCSLFKTWKNFSDFMKFVKDLDMDRMIDIPFNHADWSADNLKREWYINHESGGVEAGADDEDADKKRVRINWGAFVLDNSIVELQDYWLEKVIYPHIEKMHVNAIRIDAAWGLDREGLKRIVSKTKAKFGDKVWFLAENLGMAKLIKLAESGLAAGADRFFNNMYWYNGGLYIPTDIFTLYKQSKGAPTCTIYSSHDTLFPAMKGLAKLRANEVKGLNDKGIVRKFVEYEKITSLQQLDESTKQSIIALMKQDFALAALMSSDVMFAAGSEKALFERISVCNSSAESFKKGIESDLPDFMKTILKIKGSDSIFSAEGVIIPFGGWKAEESGIKGYLKSTDDGKHLLVAVNNGETDLECKIPKRMKKMGNGYVYSDKGRQKISLPQRMVISKGQILIITA
ncbi:MAG: hypothetical protein PHF29_02715 [Candidatus Riflebacteria bacterium]|nr:hypothetical protein [Candidatus Riflebacteria bacterium]